MRLAYGGNVLIGSATATGTASQPLQVTGGAYISGNLGVGVTNPSTKLDVAGVGQFVNTNNQILLHTGTNVPTVILRNDGSDYYHLLSAAGTTPSGTWNTLRPLTINLVNGAVSVANTSSNVFTVTSQIASSTAWVLKGITTGIANDSGLYQDASNNMQLAARDGSGTLRLVLDSNNTSGSYLNTTAGFAIGSNSTTPGYTTLATNLRLGVSTKTGTYSNSAGGTVITITCTNHGLTTGDSVYIDYTSGTAGDSYYNQVTVTNSSTFTVTGGVIAAANSAQSCTIYPETQIRFPGAFGDGGNTFDHTVISERIYGAGDDSELLIYKGNDGGTSIQDNIRLAATGDIYFHSGTGTGVYSGYINSFGNSLASSTVSILASGNVGVGTVNPGAKLEVFGTSRFGGTTSAGRRADIATDGILTLAYGNNTNTSNLILQNISDVTSTTNHGNSILWQFGTNTTTTAISAGRINILKEQQWTTTASTQDSYFSVDLAVDGTLTEKLKVTSAGNLTAGGSVTASNDVSLGGELNFSNATNKYIDFYTTDDVTNYTAHLRLVNNTSSSFHLGMTMTRGGAVTLYHNNSAKLATSADGASVTGNLTVSGGGITTGAAVASNLFGTTTTAAIEIGGALTTGAIRIGSTTGSGAINIGNTGTAAAQAVNIATATTGTITIGGATSLVNIATGSATGTVQIGTTTAAAQQIIIGSGTTSTISIGGTGSPVNIATGASTGAIQIGSTTASAQNITIGGTTTGTINIGSVSGANTINVGSTSSTAVNLPTGKTKVGQTFLLQGGAVNITLPTAAGTLVGSGDTTLPSSITASSLTSVGTLTGLTVTGTGTNAISLTTGTTGVLTLDSGSTGGINIGTNTNAKTITIGNATGATSVVLNCGTGALNIGSNAIARTITVGNSTGASTLALNAGTGFIRFNTHIADSNGNELIKFPTAVASAVNEITISNAPTGIDPTIEASGSDTDVSLGIYPKGTGYLYLGKNSVGSPLLTVTQTQFQSVASTNLFQGSVDVNGTLSVANPSATQSRINHLNNVDTIVIDNGNNTYNYKIAPNGSSTDSYFAVTGIPGTLSPSIATVVVGSTFNPTNIRSTENYINNPVVIGRTDLALTGPVTAFNTTPTVAGLGYRDGVNTFLTTSAESGFLARVTLLVGGGIIRSVVSTPLREGAAYRESEVLSVNTPESIVGITSATGSGSNATVNFLRVTPIDCTSSGSGTTVTLTFAVQQTYAPYPVGSTITVTGLSVAGHNGTFTVTGCTTTTVTYTNATTGSGTGGTVSIHPFTTAHRVTITLVTPTNYNATNVAVISSTATSVTYAFPGAATTTPGTTGTLAQGTTVTTTGQVTVSTVRKAGLSILNSSLNTIRLEATETTSTTSSTILGNIVFSAKDLNSGGYGDKVQLRGVAEGTQGGGRLEVWTSQSGLEPSLGFAFTGTNEFKLYNSTGTFSHTFTNSPTGNRILTIPDVTTTLVGTDATQTLSNKTYLIPFTQGAGTALTATQETTNQPLFPVPGDTITLAAGVYEVKMLVFVTRGATSTTASQLRINLLGAGTAAGTFTGIAIGFNAGTGASTAYHFSAVNINTNNTVAPSITTAAGSYQTEISGIIKITTAGTFIPAYGLTAVLTSATTTTTCSATNYMRLIPISTSGTTTVQGGWA